MDAEINIGGYENIYVDCPVCGEENIYNRVSDLMTTNGIARMNNLLCSECEARFSICGDEIVSGNWKWFINELSVYKKRKEYRMYIFNLCQGCEVFFKEAIIKKYMDRKIDLIKDSDGRIISDRWNEERAKLNETRLLILKGQEIGNDKSKKFEKCTFDDLRQIFLYQYRDEKKNDIGNLQSMKYDKRNLTFSCIENTDINKTRNKIIHKDVHRPTLEEVEKYGELVKSLNWLSKYLKI